MSAEQQYRSAFERLKAGTPTILPKGALVTQNNVAREAGTDPSALKKSRFPTLIAEIQRYVTVPPHELTASKRQEVLKQRKKNRATKEQLTDALAQRDQLASKLLEADMVILELRDQLAEYERKTPASNVVDLGLRNTK